MRWENYTINDTVIPVVEQVKTDALNTLRREYGRFYVDPDIYDDFLSDVFMYFPILLQQLAISRLLDAYVVNQFDTETETTTRTESRNATMDQNTIGTSSANSTDNLTENRSGTNTGTVDNESSSEDKNAGTVNIANGTIVKPTGSRGVSLSHAMPEQAFDGTTGEFPVDEQGTPILGTAYVQSAGENFSTTNQMENEETSEQTTDMTLTATGTSKQTNNLATTDEGSSNRTGTNTGTDETTLTGTNNEAVEVTETREAKLANKQYAQEVTGFLAIAGNTVAFDNWAREFSWVVGIQ